MSQLSLESAIGTLRSMFDDVDAAVLEAVLESSGSKAFAVHMPM